MSETALSNSLRKVGGNGSNRASDNDLATKKGGSLTLDDNNIRVVPGDTHVSPTHKLLLDADPEDRSSVGSAPPIGQRFQADQIAVRTPGARLAKTKAAGWTGAGTALGGVGTGLGVGLGVGSVTLPTTVGAISLGSTIGGATFGGAALGALAGGFGAIGGALLGLAVGVRSYVRNRATQRAGRHLEQAMGSLQDKGRGFTKAEKDRLEAVRPEEWKSLLHVSSWKVGDKVDRQGIREALVKKVATDGLGAARADKTALISDMQGRAATAAAAQADLKAGGWLDRAARQRLSSIPREDLLDLVDIGAGDLDTGDNDLQVGSPRWRELDTDARNIRKAVMLRATKAGLPAAKQLKQELMAAPQRLTLKLPPNDELELLAHDRRKLRKQGNKTGEYDEWIDLDFTSIHHDLKASDALRGPSGAADGHPVWDRIAGQPADWRLADDQDAWREAMPRVAESAIDKILDQPQLGIDKLYDDSRDAMRQILLAVNAVIPPNVDPAERLESLSELASRLSDPEALERVTKPYNKALVADLASGSFSDPERNQHLLVQCVIGELSGRRLRHTAHPVLRDLISAGSTTDRKESQAGVRKLMDDMNVDPRLKDDVARHVAPDGAHDTVMRAYGGKGNEQAFKGALDRLGARARQWSENLGRDDGDQPAARDIRPKAMDKGVLKRGFDDLDAPARPKHVQPGYIEHVPIDRDKTIDQNRADQPPKTEATKRKTPPDGVAQQKAALRTAYLLMRFYDNAAKAAGGGAKVPIGDVVTKTLKETRGTDELSVVGLQNKIQQHKARVAPREFRIDPRIKSAWQQDDDLELDPVIEEDPTT